MLRVLGRRPMVGIVATIPMLAKTLQAGIGAKMQCLLKLTQIYFIQKKGVRPPAKRPHKTAINKHFRRLLINTLLIISIKER